MARVRTGHRRKRLALACILVGAAVTGVVLWPTSSSNHAPRRAATGPTGPNRPAYPSLLKHVLAGVTSIEIRGAAGTTTIVKRPAKVRKIVGWLDVLPRPADRRGPGSNSDWCSGYRPSFARFDFRGAGDRVLLRAVDRLGYIPGFCDSTISFNERALLDDDFLSRVSGLIGVDLSANPRTLRNEEAAKRDAQRLLGLVRVPPGSQPLATFQPTIAGPPTNSVTARRVWRVHMPFLQVYKWEKAHPPRGSGPGDFSGAVGWDPNHGRPIADRGEGYGYPSIAGRTSGGEVDLDVSHYVRHGTWTRISFDVTETWIIARPGSEKIPSGVRTLVIRGLGRRVRRITRPDVVARIVRWFDSKRVVQSYVGECGRGGTHPRAVRITFFGAEGKALATATDPRTSSYGGGCNPISLRAAGRKEPDLDPGIEDSFERLLP